MSVFVLNQRCEPLMPTTARKARVLLKEGKAKVVRRTPFTIQLSIATGETKQEVILGVDTGSKMVGLSVVTPKKEVFSGELTLRNDVVDLLTTRRQNRRTRRSRLRYRAPRFLNRGKKGKLAPSVNVKIEGHLKVIGTLHKVLPITKIIVETASFDIQKIKNPDIKGVDYQKGEQLGFANVKAYVLSRDDYKCKSGKVNHSKKLHVHHIKFRSDGGSNAPNNLITLCEDCHCKLHKGELKLNFSKKINYRDMSFMGIMRKALLSKLSLIYDNVEETFGYITKEVRIANNLPKEHRVDALCITGNPEIEKCKVRYILKQARRQNRQIHKVNILKGGKKKLNQASWKVKGFGLFDRILFDKIECFIFGRRATGYFDLRKLDGTIVHRSGSFKKLELLERKCGILIERYAIPPLA